MVIAASRVFTRPPVVMGHRGLGRGVVDGHAENTIGSIVAAAAIAPWVEVDVRRTADDALVVHHNPALEDGTPIAVATAEAAQAAGLPLLSDVLAALPETTGVNFEVKSALEDALRPGSLTTAALVAPIAAEHARRRPVLVSSFDPAALGVIADLAPRVHRGLVTWLKFPVGIAVAAAAGSEVEVLCVHAGSLEPNRIEPVPQHPGVERIVQVAHEAGLEVMAWCPDAPRARIFIDAGVDAVCVNDLPAASTALVT